MLVIKRKRKNDVGHKSKKKQKIFIIKITKQIYINKNKYFQQNIQISFVRCEN